MSIAIALTKGRLEKETIKLLEKSGYGIDSWFFRIRKKMCSISL